MRLTPPAFTITLAALNSAPAIAQECDEGFRPFAHASGETCVPDNPQRIASLNDLSATTTLIELGDRIAMAGSAWGKAINGLNQVSAILTNLNLNRDLVAE